MDRFSLYCLQKQKRELQSAMRAIFRKPAPLHNFASTDFLDLTGHPYVKALAIYYSEKWGVGSLPTRPIKHYEERLFHVEKEFASLLGQETASFFLPSSKQVASLVLPFVQKESLLLQSSTLPLHLPTHKVASLRFNTCELSSLPLLLSNALNRKKKPILLLESISPSTGKFIDIDYLLSLKKDYPCTILIDDTLSLGLYGKNSLGRCSFKEGIDLLFGLFSKTFGYYALYMATSEATKHYLFKRNPELLASSLIPPIVLGMIDASMQLIPAMNKERSHLLNLSTTLKTKLLHTKLSFSDAPFFTWSFPYLDDLQKFHQFLTRSDTLPGLLSPHLMRFLLSSSHLESHIGHLIDLFDSYTPTPDLIAL